MTKNVYIIAAIDSQNGLSKNGVIPWDIPNDRKYFRDHVSKGPVLMGWNTYKENGLKPYCKGQNYVATRDNEVNNKEIKVVDIENFLSEFKDEIWVAGGGKIYSASMGYATKLYLTRVEGDFNCDIFFPGFSVDFCLAERSEIKTDNGFNYRVEVWERLS